ncbi:D-alanine--D-alanine ligase family protein [Candidatus Soleaferrea massiliensis]|uniref:D-alanine--D-alanine ligase family protein n=1 Tax=Candidatus Soleaferrea massiliensis TaxID=1470354 RepID=UPI00058E059A|nr:D-alanine--D-alanine ligase family protein [Candidatus Soleaferrea massiliensis]
MAKQTVAVIFGGVSSEYSVSLVSASSCLENIPKEKYDIIMLGITADGRWYLYDGPIDSIRNDSWQNEAYITPAVISPDRRVKGIVVFEKGGFREIQIDAAFPVLHGKNGEDGTIQGLFQLAGIPFVGCDMLSSAICMDKEYTHTVLSQAGIRNAKYMAVHRNEIGEFDRIETLLKEKLCYPMFVKPANAGSSVGVSKAKDSAALKAALELAFRHDGKAIVEETIVGHEVECAVLGNDKPFASVIGEIESCNEFYDYEAKYVADSKLQIPAKVDKTISDLVRDTAVKAYQALGCAGLSRVDFFITQDGGVILNEVNTIPGFTSISMYPKMMQESGIPYGELLDRLIQFALERAEVHG